MTTKEAVKILNNQFSFSALIASRNYGSCVELVVDRWGDIRTFRVYNNGEITER